MTARASRPSPALLALAGAWGYASGIHGSVAPLLARDFALGDAEVAALGAWLGAAALAALAIGGVADRIGRRRALLGCAGGLPVAAALCALARGPGDYLVGLLAAYGLGSALLALVAIALADELPRERLASGQGSAGLAVAIGTALPLAVTALVAPRAGGWRAVWALAALPLLALPWLARAIREPRGAHTPEGGDGAAVSGAPAGWRALLGPAHRARALPALGAALAIQGAEAVARAWLLYHPVRDLGMAPRAAAGVLAAGGALGLLGFRVGGRVADTRGRRPALLAGGSLFALGAAGYYGATPPRGAAGAAWLMVSLAALAAGGNAALAAFRALTAELLPPALRGTFAGGLAACGALGWSLAMLAVAALAAPLGVGAAVACVVLVALPLAALLLARLPETAAPRGPATPRSGSAASRRPGPSPAGGDLRGSAARP